MHSNFLRALSSLRINRPVACGLGVVTPIIAYVLLDYGLNWATNSSSSHSRYFLLSLLLGPLASAVYWAAEVNLELKLSNLQAFSIGLSSVWILVQLARVIR
jgi:hypothetical protein